MKKRDDIPFFEYQNNILPLFKRSIDGLYTTTYTIVYVVERYVWHLANSVVFSMFFTFIPGNTA